MRVGDENEPVQAPCCELLQFFEVLGVALGVECRVRSQLPDGRETGVVYVETHNLQPHRFRVLRRHLPKAAASEDAEPLPRLEVAVRDGVVGCETGAEDRGGRAEVETEGHDGRGAVVNDGVLGEKAVGGEAMQKLLAAFAEHILELAAFALN